MRLEKPEKDKKFEKNASFIKKIAYLCHIKNGKLYMANKFFSVTYYQTLKDDFLTLASRKTWKIKNE